MFCYLGVLFWTICNIGRFVFGWYVILGVLLLDILFLGVLYPLHNFNLFILVRNTQVAFSEMALLKNNQFVEQK